MGKLNDLLGSTLGRVGREGVFFDEMEHPPQLITGNDQLELRAWNSMRNSAKSIQRVDFQRRDGALCFTAEQGLVGKPTNPTTVVFSYAILGIAPSDLPECDLFWLDPDGQQTPLPAERDTNGPR